MALTFTGTHLAFLNDTTPEIDLEGGRMSGKTWVCSAKVINSCVAYPGIWWLICRYSGTETDNQLRPVFKDVCRQLGVEPEWHSDESAYWFPPVDGKISKVFAYGIKSQSKDERFAKIRGSGVSGCWNDQSEELPSDLATEIRALLRQPGFPHQLIFSPNPPGEEHQLADDFPEDESIPGRKLYRLSLYDNKHNLRPDTIEQLEKAFPPTHAKNKSLIYGLRGPNITGHAVYERAFQRKYHLKPLVFDPSCGSLFEAFDAGKHHPSWLVVQQLPLGSFRVLGGILGKRMLLDDFLPIVDHYREEWFGNAPIKTCCDPSPSEDPGRFTAITILRAAGLEPRARMNSNAPDVRVSMIEYLGGLMRRRTGDDESFLVNSDLTHWLMASHVGVKQTNLMIDSLECSYVWSPLYVSVGNKTVRQPLFDEWLEGWQRCLENIALNFCAGQRTRQLQPRGERVPAQVRGTEMDYMS